MNNTSKNEKPKKRIRITKAMAELSNKGLVRLSEGERRMFLGELHPRINTEEVKGRRHR